MLEPIFFYFDLMLQANIKYDIIMMWCANSVFMENPNILYYVQLFGENCLFRWIYTQIKLPTTAHHLLIKGRK